MAIPFFEEDMEIISKLGTRPKEENGVSEPQLKALFDRGGMLIKKFLNETLIPQLNMTIDVQHLLNGILDSTLAKADKAANAYATGKAIAEVKDIAEKALPKAGGTMTGILNMGHQKLINVPVPTSEYDAANKRYVDNKKTPVAVILPAEAWKDNKQTIENAAVTPDSVIFFGFAEGTDADRACNIRCVGQEEGKMIFSCKWKPSGSVTMNVVIWN